MLRGQRLESRSQAKDRHQRRKTEIPQGRSPRPGEPARVDPRAPFGDGDFLAHEGRHGRRARPGGAEKPRLDGGVMRGQQAGATERDPVVPFRLERRQAFQVLGAEAMALRVDGRHRNTGRMQAGRGGDDFSAEQRRHAELDDAGARAAFEVDDMDGDR